MIGNTWKLATVMGIVGAIAFSVASADARTKRKPANARAAVNGIVIGGPVIGGPYAYQRSFRRSYNYYRPSTGYFGTGTFSQGGDIPGTNFNPNQ